MAGFGGAVNSVQNTHQLDAILGGRDAVRPVQDTINVVIDLVIEQAVEAEGGRGVQLYVGQITVDVSVHLQVGIQLGARLRAEQLDFAFILFDIQAEAGLHGKHRAVVEADQGP